MKNYNNDIMLNSEIIKTNENVVNRILDMLADKVADRVITFLLNRIDFIKDNASPESDEFLTRLEACHLLKVGETKFNELRQKGIVEPIRLGKKTIYKKKDLLNIKH